LIDHLDAAEADVAGHVDEGILAPATLRLIQSTDPIPA
jgi:hypothetical protein